MTERGKLINFDWDNLTPDLDKEGNQIYVLWAEDSISGEKIAVVITQEYVDQLDKKKEIN